MKAQIILDYKGKKYKSELKNITEKDLEIKKNSINQATKGELYNLYLKSKNETYFFNEHILKKSIITLIVKE